VSPRELPKRSAIAGIRLYQVTLSPYLGRQCRFYPTCSHYAREALEQHGFVRGAWLAIRRLGRCHPFHPGGVDLVPPRNARVATSASTCAADRKES
jgi:uncharacterized protein